MTRLAVNVRTFADARFLSTNRCPLGWKTLWAVVVKLFFGDEGQYHQRAL